jgi:hypothetical protein
MESDAFKQKEHLARTFVSVVADFRVTLLATKAKRKLSLTTNQSNCQADDWPSFQSDTTVLSGR